MKKIIALILLVCMLLSVFACSKPQKNEDSNENISDNDSQNKNEQTPTVETIVVPAYKDYNRGTVDFKDLVYSRPNVQEVIDSFASVTLSVEKNEKAIDEQIEDIRALEAPLDNVNSMYAIAQIRQSKDSSSEYWHTEYEYISTNFPKISQAVEDLLIACAKSSSRTEFEENYFNYSLEEYVDGGIYTDEAVRLMQLEASLEAEYSSLSTATVEIVYKPIGTDIVWEGTVDEVMDMAKEHFKSDSQKYNEILPLINDLYQYKVTELTKPIYIELLKVRRLIADELDYSNYSELAYESMDYDYLPEDMMNLIGDIGEYTFPIASTLSYYLRENAEPHINTVSVINNLYKVYSELGGNYMDAFSYMLQHGLYDISPDNENRYDGAFSVYIDNNSSPYLFMTSSGFIRDYNTLSHEFGHFLDGYINYGEDDSLAVMEISSQALELLTMLKLQGVINTKDYEYLEHYTMFSFLNNVLLMQCLYSAFEHMAYDLKYEEITAENLEKAVQDAYALVFGENTSVTCNLSMVSIPHTLLYPFYVESYVTSGLVSLEIFFAESQQTGKSGDGFAIYEVLINRGSTKLTFTERLEAAGLGSPFENGAVKRISNNVYYQIMGKNYPYPQDNTKAA